MIVTVTQGGELYAVFALTGATSTDAFIAWTWRMCELDNHKRHDVMAIDAVYELRAAGYVVSVTGRGV